jgi:hypothetical protein
MMVRVDKGGQARKATTQEAALLLLAGKALKGERAALELFLNLCLRFNNETAFDNDKALSNEDHAILDAFKAEIGATPERPTPSAAGDGKMLLRAKRRSKK